MEDKEGLLFLSDRICSRLFAIVHGIKAQAEAAESLSPAIRSADSTSQFSSNPSSLQLEIDHLSVTNPNQVGTTNALGFATSPIQALLEEIEAKYST
ncbi:prohibitin PHB1 [Pseudozyma hubeiensis SY62]|uniref:Prohibitin PHB1 n=1 Tax=Pseudozyma hubeiensis (strain SY62) TaxID=1305764 RepID=R9NYE7_PSEHS|nr:prohibitin PHB1 [Pseudozyma hubeiensis SY62]GAC93647.1 prohibitin PHB1 [Pseudozyma hubeiensis SY62]